MFEVRVGPMFAPPGRPVARDRGQGDHGPSL